MTIHWSCQTCGETGTTDRDAEQHVTDTKHGVLTSARPIDRRRLAAVHEGDKMSRRYWLTEAGWAAVGGRST